MKLSDGIALVTAYRTHLKEVPHAAPILINQYVDGCDDPRDLFVSLVVLADHLIDSLAEAHAVDPDELVRLLGALAVMADDPVD